MTTKLLAPTPQSAAEAAKIIINGGLVAIPTETVYGLGANGLNPEAVKKIFLAKGRPQDNPLILHLSSPQEIDLYCHHIPEAAYKLAERFWPGPLTMVLPARDIVPKETTSGLDTVALRCPDCLVTRQVIAQAGVPIAAPSANTSGKPSPTTAQHVIDDMEGKIDAVIDAGPCQVGVESTIIDLSGEAPRLLRPGGLPVEDIESVIGPVTWDKAILGDIKDDEVVRAPGMKYRHYAPKAPVTVFRGDPAATAKAMLAQAEPNTGIICYDEYASLFQGCTVMTLGPKGDRLSHAQRVFDDLRHFDDTDVTRILAQCPDDHGLDMAVANRLKKAAGFNVVDVPKEVDIMKIIGITGGTGCGKTTVLEYLKGLDAWVIDCDAVYHQLLATSAPLLEELDSAFPGVVKDGALDRKALGSVVFADDKALARLNDITHRYIQAEVSRQIETQRAAGRKLCAVDAIALLEGQLKDQCDFTVGVIAPTEVRVRRLMARECITEEYAKLRISAQKPNEYFEKNCDYTLNNSFGTIEEFHAQCKKLFDQVL